MRSSPSEGFASSPIRSNSDPWPASRWRCVRWASAIARSRLASSPPRAPAQRVEGAGLHHALQPPLVQVAVVHPREELLDSGERLALSRLDDPLDDALAHVLDVRQPEAYRPLRARPSACGSSWKLTPLRFTSGGRTSMPRAAALRVRLGHALGGARGVVPRHDEHRRHVLFRVVRLQVRRLVGDRRVGDGVRLVEGVAGERLDQIVYLLRLLAAVALGGGALQEPLLLRRTSSP